MMNSTVMWIAVYWFDAIPKKVSYFLEMSDGMNMIMFAFSILVGAVDAY